MEFRVYHINTTLIFSHTLDLSPNVNPLGQARFLEVSLVVDPTDFKSLLDVVLRARCRSQFKFATKLHGL
jgi:hypothetical protein